MWQSRLWGYQFAQSSLKGSPVTALYVGVPQQAEHKELPSHGPKQKVHRNCVWVDSFKQFMWVPPVTKGLSLDSAAPLRQGWEPLPPISRLRASEDSSASGALLHPMCHHAQQCYDRTVPSWRWPHVDSLFCRAAQNNLHLPNSVGKNQQLYALVPGWAV